nr:hypothetical protein Itr_chr13CG16840 [Ipomoea trifida]
MVWLDLSGSVGGEKRLDLFGGVGGEKRQDLFGGGTPSPPPTSYADNPSGVGGEERRPARSD